MAKTWKWAIDTHHAVQWRIGEKAYDPRAVAHIGGRSKKVKIKNQEVIHEE